MGRLQEAEGFVGGDAVGGDELPEREVPPHIGVAEGLHSEHEDDDRRAGDPRQPAPVDSSPLVLSVRDDDQVRALSLVLRTAAGARLPSCPHTLFAGYEVGAGGRCRLASFAAGTNTTLNASWYTFTQPAVCSITSASGVLTS